ncbi:MAG: hypothetical protein ISQ08_09490 [Planctomycetes bacterium]|nr:hypothetical protein [Planctomycetota bacterium]
MSSSEHDTNRRNEVLGIGLFLAGSLPLVLVVLSLIRPPAEDVTGAAALAAGLAGAFGAAPVILLSAGLAAFGGWLFTGGNVKDPVPHLAGLVGSSAGLSVLLGAWSADLGGNLGLRTGARIADQVHPALGLFVGASIVFLSAWLTWFRGEARPTKAREKGNDPATLSDALSEAKKDGVSALETSALVPDEATLQRMEELWRQPSTPELHPAAGSPYPEDVRLTGKIPDGARPIGQAPDEPLQRPTPGPVEPPSRAAAPAGERDGDDLVAAASADGLDPLSIAAVLAQEDAAAPAAEPVVLRPTWEQVASDEADEELFAEEDLLCEEDEADDTEESELHEEDEAEEAEESELHEEAEEEEAEESELEESEEWEDEAEEAYDDSEEEAEEEAELEEAEGDEDDSEEAEFEDTEAEDEEAYDDSEAEEGNEEAELEDGEEEEDFEESELEEEEAWEEDDSEEMSAEDASTEEDLDEECELEDEEAGEEDFEVSELEEEEVQEAQSQEAQSQEAQSQEAQSQEAEPEAPPAPRAARKRTVEEAPSLFPETLSPAGSSRKKKPAVMPKGEGSLLHEAGCLFLSEGRVAVSMLQRTFDLDFQAACDLLDDLQEEGLIGPYKGGQQRDILLTLEEWQARTPAS